MSGWREDPDRELARTALRSYGLDGSLSRVATGVDSTYRLTTRSGLRFAVRIGGEAPFRRPEAMAMEAAWMASLATSQVAVPEVVRNASGGDITVVEGSSGRRGCLVVTWLPGIKMRWRFGARQAFALGAAAAHLHAAAAGFPPPAGAWAKDWSAELMAGTGGEQTLARVAGDGAGDVLAAVRERLEDAGRDLGGGDWTLINGDLGPHNTRYDRGVPQLFDFNDLGWGYTGYDFARYLHGLRWRPRGEQLVDAATQGYRSVRPTPRSWDEHGELFEVAAGLFLASYLAPKVAERGPDTLATVRRLLGRAEALVGV